MDADLQNKKTALIEWLSTLKDMSVIEKVMKVRENERSYRISEAKKGSVEDRIRALKCSAVQKKNIVLKWMKNIMD